MSTSSKSTLESTEHDWNSDMLTDSYSLSGSSSNDLSYEEEEADCREDSF